MTTALCDTLRVHSSLRQGRVLYSHQVFTVIFIFTVIFNIYKSVIICLFMQISSLIMSEAIMVNQTCMACIMYADDLILLSASVCGLQLLLDVCAATGKDLCLQFNGRKSHYIATGPRHRCELAPVYCMVKFYNGITLDIKDISFRP